MRPKIKKKNAASAQNADAVILWLTLILRIIYWFEVDDSW